jgi:uncharacterized protein with FMN-binding domain
VSRAVLATTATVAGVVLMLSLKPHQSPTAASAAPVTPPVSPSTTGAPNGGPTGGSPSATRDPGRLSGAFTGDTVTTAQGPVQVRITMDQGRLTAVDVLQGVHERGPSADAVPRLTQQALAAQNAQIDAVSGATFTSEGYISSLQSALDRARG